MAELPLNYRHGDWRVKARRGIFWATASIDMNEIAHLIRTRLPPSVRVEDNGGRLPRLSVRSAVADAEVYFQGAQITAWRPAASPTPVLWLSRESLFEPGQPIRGGVPICFPWFSKHPADAAAPPHGFARTRDWTLVDAREDAAGAVTLELELEGEGLSPQWPHRVHARHRIGIGALLRMDLEVFNPGPHAFAFEEALHAYFDVHDIREVTLAGLEGAEFLDKVGGSRRGSPSVEPLRFAGLTNRVYPNTHAACVIRDPARRRDIVISKSGSNSTVVWNPWAERARDMSDFGDDEWRGMVCVEPSNVGSDARTLPPGASHTMTVVVETRESSVDGRDQRP
jgi:glucose-6-phosphate 1-epimerase